MVLQKNIHSLVGEFKVSNPNKDKWYVNEMVKKLKEYFENIYKDHLTKYPNQKISKVGFMVAGYDSSGVGKLFDFVVPNGEIKERKSTSNNFGPVWKGQTDIIVRLIKGCSPELAKILHKHNKDPETKPEQKIEPFQFEYVLGFEYMTIKDAIDFADFLIRATVETQRFSYGTKEELGAIPGVGGEIDIAIITPEGFKWIQKKELK